MRIGDFVSRKGCGLRILVTAGPTCEDIDDVRCITNRSSGRMGLAVVAEALRRGHEVDLVLGPVEIAPPAGARVTRIRNARDLLAACQRLFPGCDALVAAAAVADYRPARRTAGKIKKSGDGLTLRLVPNPDVAALLGGMKRPEQTVVGFALETAASTQARANAEAKMAAKRQDFAVLNSPAALGAGEAEVSFLTAGGGWTGPEKLGKDAIAARILDFVEKRAAGTGSKS
ncbi:MAG TPA: phosphopantothenoylcysteine decarboxylase [Planctomycetota bacterium]|nr:phosphopantothenoylcysteine decarboxylase [Planctomycetota bacterium]